LVLVVFSLKENTHIEFKSSFNDAVIETLSAFANTKGGKVIVGLNDKGLPLKNFSVGNETIQQWINEIKTKTQPSIIADAEVKKVKGKVIVELSIQEFPIKPVAFKSRFYKRVNNSNHILSVSEISDLYMQSLQVSWDSYAYRNATFGNLNISKIKAFIKKVNDGGRFSLPVQPKEALLKLKLINGKEVSNAAMILFSTENLRYNVHVGRFKTPSFIIDDRLISGNLFDVLSETMQFIIGHLKVAFEINGNSTQRTEIFEYPITAIREVLLNSLIHRDYSSPSDVQIKLFDKKISFFNPGKLFGSIEMEDLRGDSYASQTRNKLIAEAFYLTKDIEKYGSGFIRIRDEIKEYPSMRFNYAEQGNGFLAELEYSEQKNLFPDRKTTINLKKIPSSGNVTNNVTNDVTNNVTNNVTDNVTNNVTNDISDLRLQAILDVLKTNKRFSINMLAEKIGVTKRTILRDIDKLKTEGYIVRIGSTREGYWKVIRKQIKKSNA
jgi:ATP-dependent DNA helicase RecG